MNKTKKIGLYDKVGFLGRSSYVKKKTLHIGVRIAIYLLLIDIAFVFLYPFMFMVVNSLKTSEDLMNAAVNWVPRQLQFSNYKIAWDTLDYPKSFLNSFIITLLSTLGHLLSGSFVAYGFARTKFPCKNLVFVCLIFTIIVPPQVIIMSLYTLFGTFGWNNSFLPMIVPSFFGFGLRGGIYIFIFRQFFISLPKELEDAAYIDGCGMFKTFFRIVIPSSRSSFLVCGIISMVWQWNDYYEPTIYLSKPSLQPLTSLLPNIYEASQTALMDIEALASGRAITQAVVLAAIVLAEIPIFIIYMFLQKYFMVGIERTGIVE